MKKFAYLLSISLIAGSIFTGCGNGSSSSSSNTPTPTPTATATPAPTATPAEDNTTRPDDGECPGFLPC